MLLLFRVYLYDGAFPWHPGRDFQPELPDLREHSIETPHSGNGCYKACRVIMLIQHGPDCFDGISGFDVRKLLVSKGCHIFQEISDRAAVLNKGSPAQPRGLFCLVIKEKGFSKPVRNSLPDRFMELLDGYFPCFQIGFEEPYTGYGQEIFHDGIHQTGNFCYLSGTA